MNLVKKFISSNLSLTHLRNPHLFKIIKIDIPCDKSFTRRISPEIFIWLNEELEHKFSAAECMS